MTRVMGIDAALGSTGVAIWEDTVVALTKIRTTECKATPDESSRLHQIFQEISHLIAYYKPTVIVMENQHVSRLNAKTSLLLSRVRGVIQLACHMKGIPFYTLEPKEIKKAVTGNGNANKELVQDKVKDLYPDSVLVQNTLHTIITTGKNKTDDMADALAIVYTYNTSPHIAVSV